MNRAISLDTYNDMKRTKQKKDIMKEITELKAKAYDIISALEHLQSDLQKINAEIAKKTHEQAERDKKYAAGINLDDN